MIKFGLKIWSNNTQLFDEAIRRYKNSEFDFIELYSNSTVPHDYAALEVLKQIPVAAVHIGHLDKAGFHKFFLTDEQRPAWQMTRDLADFFHSPRIIVHPAITHTRESFLENIDKLNDKRITVESMPVMSPLGGPDRQFGASLQDLREIRARREICFDIAKSIKAAVYFKVPYQAFITRCINTLKPNYFHLSGGRVDNPVDEHIDLWEAGFDTSWIRGQLERIAKDYDIFLVFETPKAGEGLENDIKNMEYFRAAV